MEVLALNGKSDNDDVSKRKGRAGILWCTFLPRSLLWEAASLYRGTCAYRPLHTSAGHLLCVCPGHRFPSIKYICSPVPPTCGLSLVLCGLENKAFLSCYPSPQWLFFSNGLTILKSFFVWFFTSLGYFKQIFNCLIHLDGFQVQVPRRQCSEVFLNHPWPQLTSSCVQSQPLILVACVLTCRQLFMCAGLHTCTHAYTRTFLPSLFYLEVNIRWSALSSLSM